MEHPNTGSTRPRRRAGQPSELAQTEVTRTIPEVNDYRLDRRTMLGRALAAWKADLIKDLGGRDVVSTQQLAIIDMCVTTKLHLDSIDRWMLNQPTLVNARKRSLLPAVLQRQRLANDLAQYLTLLGLERRELSEKERPYYIITRTDSEEYRAMLRDYAEAARSGVPITIYFQPPGVRWHYECENHRVVTFPPTKEQAEAVNENETLRGSV